MLVRTILVLALAICAVTGGNAIAQDADETVTERRLRSMGIAIGNAFVCAEKEQRETFREEAHHLFDLILQDVGSDMAFVYANGVGYGSSLKKEDLDCATLLNQWAQIREDFELQEDEG